MENGETLLDAALRAGIPLNYNCASGSCGHCLARIVRGHPDAMLHHDFALRDADRERGVVLLCRTTTQSDLVIDTELASDPANIPEQVIVTAVSKLEYAAPDVMLMDLRTPRSQTLQFLAGQHVTLAIDGVTPRNKSIASCPCNGMYLQFHVRRAPEDEFADHVFTRLQLKQRVVIRGPYGHFTLDAKSTRPLLFLAYETGFAPIKSLVENAISLEMAQPMHLYWAADRPGDHYLENHCRAWLDALDNFRYTAVTTGPAPSPAGGALAQARAALMAAATAVVRDHPDLSGYDVYVSGPDRAMDDARALLLAHRLPEGRLFVDTLERF